MHLQKTYGKLLIKFIWVNDKKQQDNSSKTQRKALKQLKNDQQMKLYPFDKDKGFALLNDLNLPNVRTNSNKLFFTSSVLNYVLLLTTCFTACFFCSRHFHRNTKFFCYKLLFLCSDISFHRICYDITFLLFWEHSYHFIYFNKIKIVNIWNVYDFNKKKYFFFYVHDDSIFY